MTTLTRADTVSLPLAIRRFAVHFIEMCVVMCAGGIALDLAVFGVAGLLGYPNLVAQAPALSMLIIAVDFAIAMAVYMYVRGHPTQHNIEMSGSTVVGAIPFIGALWLGWLPEAKLASWNGLFSLMCAPLCLLMFVVMAVRFEHYGGRVGRGGGVLLPAQAGGYTCAMHPEVQRAEPGTCPLCGMALVPRHS